MIEVNHLASAINENVRAGDYLFAGGIVKESLALWKDPNHLAMLEEWVPDGYEKVGVLTARGIARMYLDTDRIIEEAK
jgi:hypothetical protein